MTDIGMSNDPRALHAAVVEAHGSIRALVHKHDWDAAEPWDVLPLDELERHSFNLHQLSALLDLHIQERSAAARPQEEANDQVRSAGETTAGTTAPPVDGVDGRSEEAGLGRPEVPPATRQ